MSSTTETSSATTSGSQSSASSSLSEDGFTSNTFGGSAPSTVLFFLALAVGVFIALLFVFFTIRYFVRSRFGLHVYPLTRRHNNILVGGTSRTNNHVELTDDELQEHIDYIRSHHFIRGEILERRLLGRNRRRRRRGGRYARMKKLTAQEVEILFPKKTYHDWLNGGQERDDANRNGALQEEGALMDHRIAGVGNNDEIAVSAAAETTLETQTSHYSDARLMPLGPSNDIELRKLDALSSTSYDPDNGPHYTSGTCAICLEVLENDDVVRGLLCGHVYHAECLDPWLTKRRACCPTCKRDYFFKSGSGVGRSAGADADEGETGEAVEEASGNNVNDAVHEDNEGSAAGNTGNEPDDGDEATRARNTHAADDAGEDFVLDLDMLRNDPTLRAMIQELVPTSERVRLILADPRNAHYDLEQRAQELAKKKYGNIIKVILWRIVGISRTDLFNWWVITLYHQARAEEQSANINSTLPIDLRLPEPAAVANNIEDDTGPTYSPRDVVDQRV